MTETKIKKNSSITVDNRKKGLITGVEKVLTSCDTSILIVTSEGNLCLTGKNMKINKFSMEDGILGFDGDIDSLKYSTTKGGSIMKRIFK